MGIYVGNDSFEERLDSMEEETLFLDAWAYAMPIDEVSQNILDIISSVVFLKEIQADVNKRKIALKIYKREKSLIEESLDKSSFERYMWIQDKEESIYPYEEQESIAKLVAFLMDKGKEHVEKATQIVVQLFPLIKARLEMEKKTLHYQKFAAQDELLNKGIEGGFELDFSKNENSKGMIQASLVNLELSLDKKITLKNLESRGVLLPLELEEEMVVTYTRYLRFFINVFYNKYIKEFKATHLFLTKGKNLVTYSDWGLVRNKSFIKKYFIKDLEVVKERLEKYYLVNKKDRTITLGTISLKLNKRNSVLSILNDYRNQILLQKKKLEEQYEKENDEAKNKSLKNVNNSLNVLNLNYSAKELAKITVKQFEEEESKRQDKYFKLLELYRLQLIACDSIQVNTISLIESEKELYRELFYLEFNQQILEDINRVFEIYKTIREDQSDKDYNWRKLPLAELGDLIDTYEIDSSIFYEDLFMFIHAALIVLQNHFSSQGIHSFELEELEQLKNSEIEKHKEEISNLKIQLTHKEKEKNRLTKENEELKEKASLSSKKDSRIESLENKLEEAQKDIERLQAELENQEPIVIEKQISNQQMSEAEVLKFLNSNEENIFFVGGHQLMIAKMRQWAQKVEFLEPRDYTKEISNKATTVIICVAYLNHGMYYKTLNRINQLREHHDVKVIYINTQSTNKEYLLKEIGSQL
jgi:hypothetical protein